VDVTRRAASIGIATSATNPSSPASLSTEKIDAGHHGYDVSFAMTAKVVTSSRHSLSQRSADGRAGLFRYSGTPMAPNRSRFG
jgi:hypothetical protein